jgi:hypothetical protein
MVVPSKPSSKHQVQDINQCCDCQERKELLGKVPDCDLPAKVLQAGQDLGRIVSDYKSLLQS